jgi:hypothetical protein
MRSADPRMRPLGGQARTTGSRHTIVAATAAIKMTNVRIQAATRRVDRAGRRPVAASRSIAVIRGRGSSASAWRFSSCSESGAATSRDDASSSSTAAHSLPQRAQRTVLRGGNRDEGTSYSAAHFGQAIRMNRIMKQCGEYWNGGAVMEIVARGSSGGQNRPLLAMTAVGANGKQSPCYDSRRSGCAMSEAAFERMGRPALRFCTTSAFA